MKNITATLAICLTIIGLSFFQSSSAQLRYGLRLGGNFNETTMKNVPDFSISNNSGFDGGLMLEYQFPRNGFAPDLAVTYSRQHTKLDNDSKERWELPVNHLSVPIRLKYKFGLTSLGGLISPMIYTGPELSWAFGDNHWNRIEIEKFQPSWHVGIGVDIVNFIQITAGYYFGLGNQFKEFSGVSNAVMRGNGWNLSVNLLFDL